MFGELLSPTREIAKRKIDMALCQTRVANIGRVLTDEALHAKLLRLLAERCDLELELRDLAAKLFYNGQGVIGRCSMVWLATKDHGVITFLARSVRRARKVPSDPMSDQSWKASAIERSASV